MDVHEKLDQVAAAVENARAMPMSSSCIVNRAELLTLVEELRALLPQDLDLADRLLSDRDQVVADARAEADSVVAAAHLERDRLVSQTEVSAKAEQAAVRIRTEAEVDAERMRDECDQYVDAKLATFEISLNKTLAAVHRGREKLQGAGELKDLTIDEQEAPLPGG